MDFTTKCLNWVQDHVVFIHGGWWIVDNDGEALDGPFSDRYDDELEISSMDFAVEYAEEWWKQEEEDELY